MVETRYAAFSVAGVKNDVGSFVGLIVSVLTKRFSTQALSYNGILYQLHKPEDDKHKSF